MNAFLKGAWKEVELNVEQVQELDGDRLRWALAAATVGIRVVPLKPNSKAGMHGWPKLATTDPSIIVGWWEKYPDCNFGLLMGQGYVCLDLDRHKEGQDGVATMRELCAEAFNTLTVNTPRNGLHLIFRRKEPVSTKHFEDGIDVIGEGTYIVSPYSRFEGKRYVPLAGVEGITYLPDAVSTALRDRLTARQAHAEALPVGGSHVDLLDEPLSEHEQAAICRRLARISPDLPYDDWVVVLFACLNVWKAKVATVQHLRDWSAQSAKFEAKAFEKAVFSYRSDRKDAPRLSTLARMASRYPRLEANSSIQIEPTEAEDVSTLTESICACSVEILTSYGSTLSREHRDALRIVARTLAEALYAMHPLRYALPLETGMGKTTSVVAVCKAIAMLGLNRSVLICCQSVEQLSDLKKAMIDAGVPTERIGLIHNSQAHKDVTANTLDEGPGFQFLLSCHQRVRLESGREDPARLVRYGEGRRDLVIWDESLIASEGHAIKLNEAIDEIAVAGARIKQRLANGRRGTSEVAAEDYRVLGQWLEQCGRELGEKDDEFILLPPNTLGVIRTDQILRSIFADATQRDTDAIALLTQIYEYGQRGEIRRMTLAGSATLLQFEQSIDDVFEKIVVLDGSVAIRDLAHYDDRLCIQPIPVTKRYDNVEIRYVEGRAGKGSLVGDASEEHFDRYSNFLLSALREISKDMPGLVFCHKQNEKRVSVALEAVKEKAGWGLAPISLLTWGRHRASNRYRDARWTFLWGLTYLPRPFLASQIMGQVGRIDYAFIDREIEDVLESELAESIYQAISRGNSRNVRNGQAGEQIVYLVIPPSHANNVLAMLNELMPGVRIRKLMSDAFPDDVRKNAAGYLALAEQIRGYLLSVPEDVRAVSTRKINDHLKVEAKDSAVRLAYKSARNDLQGWKREGRSMVRR